ncbi:MAG TPA: hypothetical protein VLT47_15345 [Anaeromyxobacteraceae bacterium]|nr:hypothetical protein [Anaeromyxobacteraceae bacterium]
MHTHSRPGARARVPSVHEEVPSRRRIGLGNPPPALGAVAALAYALAAFAPCVAAGGESLGVIAVGDPVRGIDPGLAELTHQLRAACRDRVGNVLEVSTMQARLLGQSDAATVSELDRAYGGALAVYQNGEFESALRTLRAIVADVEALPEGREPYRQWIRAQLRLAHAAATIGRFDEADAAMTRLLRVEPNYRADPDQYSPSYRRRLDEVRARVQGLPQRRVTVIGAGRAGSVFVDGRPSGTTPMTLFLPAGRYRIGGAAGSLRVPSFAVDLSEEDRTVVLDFETADAVRMASGPGLVLPDAQRSAGLVRAGAWLDVDKLIVASRAFEGDAPFLVGAIYDVRRGSILREGSVRTVAGAVPSVNIGALAAFLLTGAQQREVRARAQEAAVVVDVPQLLLASATAPATPASPAPAKAAASPVRAAQAGAAKRAPGAARVDLSPRPAEPAVPGLGEAGAPSSGPPGVPSSPPGRRWMRPAAWAAGGCALGLAALAVNRRLAADEAYDSADALTGPGGVLLRATDGARVDALNADGDAAVRHAWISAGASAVFTAAAALLGWSSAAPAGPAVAF